MKVCCFLILFVLAQAGTAQARSQIGTGVLNGEPIILYDDGFWRYGDDAGIICTPVAQVGDICAVPSDWAYFPWLYPDPYQRPVFVRDDRFSAEANALTGTESLKPVAAFMLNRTMHNGLKGVPSRPTVSTWNGQQAQTVSFNKQNGQVKIFTFASFGDRVVIAETTETGTTLNTREHKAVHANFLASIRLSEQ